jgi:GPH family glycoside/pentoside/hexuronide:cation symporter
MKFNLGMRETSISAVLMLITVCGVITVPFVSKLATIFDKKDVFMAIIGGCGIMMMSTKIIGVDSVPMLIFVCVLYAIANACYWQLMPSMIYDVCEVDQLSSGAKRSGAVISLQALSESISIAAGLQMLGIILQLAGFDSDLDVQPEYALEWVENSLVLIPGGAMVLVALIIRKFPITRNVFAKIKVALEDRQLGKEINMEEFTELF